MSAEIIDLPCRKRAAASVVPAVTLPLPTFPPVVASDTPDAALIEAEADIARLCAYLHAERDKRGEIADGEADPIYDRCRELECLIGERAPETLVGCAVKLRRLLDRDVGIDSGKSGHEILSLLQIYDFIERMTGKPLHPICPLAEPQRE